jgi:hypothetical protein
MFITICKTCHIPQDNTLVKEFGLFAVVMFVLG